MEKSIDIYEWWGKHYEDVVMACQRASVELNLPFDTDIMHDTCIKVAEHQPLTDQSDKGILNYIYRSYKTNMMRERMYARNARRANVDDALYMADEDDDERIQNEIRSDRLLKLVMDTVEQSYDITPEEFNIWRIKLISKLTYKQMSEKFGYNPRYLRRINKKVNAFINNNLRL